MSISRIEKRAAEALAIIPIIEKVSERYGNEEARSILREVNEKEAFERGRKAGNSGRNPIEALVEDVKTWGAGGEWEMEVLVENGSTYSFNVLRCPYYEKYLELGVNEYGVELSCCRDLPFARGLDRNLRLVRTQTIMEGAAYCDFRYQLLTE